MIYVANIFPALALGLLLLLASPGVRASSVSCTFEQITDTTGATGAPHSPDIDASGTRVVFASARDLTGENPDLSDELFLYNTATSALTQITDLNAAMGEFALSGDGAWVAMTSPASLYGTFELFRVETATAISTQLTPDTFQGTSDPAINGDGSILGFASNKNLTGANGDFSDETFLAFPGEGFAQVTGDTSSAGTTLSRDGGRVAFRVEDSGTHRLYVSGTSGAPWLAAVETLSVNDHGPAISDDGSIVAFVSGDDGNDEVYIRDLWLSSTTQLSTTASLRSRHARIDARGERVVFERTDGFFNQTYLYDAVNGEEHALTLATSASVSISDDGTRIALHSSGNMAGGNPDGNREIFIATCDAPASRLVELQLDALDLFWSPAPGATVYDVVSGDLDALRAGGDFTASTDACLADDRATTNLAHGGDPSTGAAFWYLVRPVGSTFVGTYDARSMGQLASRDVAIAASTVDCP